MAAAAGGGGPGGVIEVERLAKTFRIGFFMKKVEAVRDVSFTVAKGEIFGLLGPNGAGKTTTLKALTGLIRPTRGKITVLGMAVPDGRIRRRMGFLPENPYFYEYLSPFEYLVFAGALFGMGRDARRGKAEDLLARVGLAEERDRPLRRFSKGMLQRLGVAQALVNDPEVLVLDEPMSGLDPIGRREVRELILAQRAAGKTILFSSHILTDVEMICDRVAIVNRGVVTSVGALGDLLRPEVRRTVIEAEGLPASFEAEVEGMCLSVTRVGAMLQMRIEGDANVDRIVDMVRGAGGRLASVVPHRETLEDVFVRDALGSR